MRSPSALVSLGPNQSPPEGGSFSSLQAVEASSSQGFLQVSEILDQILRWGSGTGVLGPAGHKCVCARIRVVHVHAHVSVHVCKSVLVHVCASVNMCESVFVQVDMGRGQGGPGEEGIV